MGRSRKLSSNQRTIINSQYTLSCSLHHSRFSPFDFLHHFEFLHTKTISHIVNTTSFTFPFFFRFDLDLLWACAWYQDSLYGMVNGILDHITYFTLFFHVLCYLLRCSFMQICVHVHVPDSGLDDAMYEI